MINILLFAIQMDEEKENGNSVKKFAKVKHKVKLLPSKIAQSSSVVNESLLKSSIYLKNVTMINDEIRDNGN